MMPAFLKRQILRILPKRLELPGRYYFYRLFGRMEPELIRLGDIVTRRGRAIDIGANLGLYTYRLSQLSKVVEAFEPQLFCVDIIRSFRDSHINVYPVALGAKEGELALNVPVRNGKLERPLAAFRDLGGNVIQIGVPVKRLDDYDFTDVSIIKIDVEGYERDVIEGALATIQRERPVLLIEIEQRHLGNVPIQSVFSRIESLGYRGFFFRDDQICPISDFSVECDQLANIADVHSINYVNNFIFKPT